MTRTKTAEALWDEKLAKADAMLAARLAEMREQLEEAEAELAKHVIEGGIRMTCKHPIQCAYADDGGGCSMCDLEAERDAICPCKHTTPCHPDCACVNPASSRGCERCCTHGSKEQQKSRAESIAKVKAERDAALDVCRSYGGHRPDCRVTRDAFLKCNCGWNKTRKELLGDD